jgi:hypothetical protein
VRTVTTTLHHLFASVRPKKRPAFGGLGVNCAVTRMDAWRGLPASAENGVQLASGGAEPAGPDHLPLLTYA